MEDYLERRIEKARVERKIISDIFSGKINIPPPKYRNAEDLEKIKK